MQAPVSISASTRIHFPLKFILAASSSDTSRSKVLMPPSPSTSSLKQLINCTSPCSSPSGSSLQPSSSHIGLIPDHHVQYLLEWPHSPQTSQYLLKPRIHGLSFPFPLPFDPPPCDAPFPCGQ